MYGAGAGLVKGEGGKKTFQEKHFSATIIL